MHKEATATAASEESDDNDDENNTLIDIIVFSPSACTDQRSRHGDIILHSVITIISP